MARGGKREGAGRPKGAVAKDTASLIAAMQEKYPDYDPVMAMIEIANDPEVDNALRLTASKEVAQYVYPKRKAVEHSGPGGTPLIQVFNDIAPKRDTDTKAV